CLARIRVVAGSQRKLGLGSLQCTRCARGPGRRHGRLFGAGAGRSARRPGAPDVEGRRLVVVREHRWRPRLAADRDRPTGTGSERRMSTPYRFHLPDLGEGLPDATIVEWFVKVGDSIQLDEPLISM